MATRTHGSAKRTPARPTNQRNTSERNEPQRNEPQRNEPQRNDPQRNAPQRNAPQRNASQRNPARRSSSQTPVRGTVTAKRSAPGRSTAAPTTESRGRHSPVGAQQRRATPTQPEVQQQRRARSAQPEVQQRRAKSAASQRKRTRQPEPRSRKNVRAVKPDLRAAERGVGAPQRRLRIALVVIALIFVGIIGRVGYIQTKEADSLQSAGESQWTRSYELPAQRGTMFDRNGNELAMSVPAASISINPKLIVDGPAVLNDLHNLLNLSDEKMASLTAELNRPDKRGFVYVARQVDANVGDFVRALGYAGVNVDDESRREMPGGDTGRSVLGRTNIDGDGIAGLEQQYNDVLTGTGGSMTREVDPKQRTIAGSESITQAPVDGDDLVLTLDRSVQFATEEVLLAQLERLGAKGGSVVVQETSTGEILGMASVRRDAETGEYGVTGGNFAAVDAYEPGSVAKVITVAGALDAGVVTPETRFNVPWRKQYYDNLLSDSHEHPDLWLTVSDILTESSNIGTIMVQETLGRFKHYDYMADFGLGSKTALDFPGESPGILKAPEDLWGSERVTVAYGQGVSSTSIQLVSAVNTIANGGTYVAPKLVSATVGPDGAQTPMPESPSRRVVSELAAAQTTAMMVRVVCDDAGTASRAQVEGIAVAGKTGTAYKAADNGTYYNDEGQRVYYASFVGFFPADDPQVTVLVSVDEPPADTHDRFGGTAAAPVFAALVPTLVHELGIQPAPGSTGCAG